MDFFSEMESRGLVHDSTPGLREHLQTGSAVGYIGFDPTAASLHVGSLLPVIALKRFQAAGHKPIAILGGGTGLIGDPSGKETERSMITPETINTNLKGIRQQLESILEFDMGPISAELINNADWLLNINLVEFLRDVGKGFSVREMVARDSVKQRLDRDGQGMSYTEFSYMLLQAFDFDWLFREKRCTLQMGGSDQWGNIVDGCNLIRRREAGKSSNADAAIDLARKVKEVGPAYGLTFPLITRSDGKKFGKSELGNVWLDPKLTTPYEFYQFWLNTADADVGNYLAFFTFLPMAQVEELKQDVVRNPEARTAQRELARHLTDLVHHRSARDRAERATEILFNDAADWAALSAADLRDAFSHTPTTSLKRDELGLSAKAALDTVLAGSTLYSSKAQARKGIEDGAVYVNNRPVTDTRYVLASSDIRGDEFIVLRRGKKTYHVLRIE